MSQELAADRRVALARALLEGHRPADEVEARHRVAMLELLAREERPFDRERFSPGHFTASGFVLTGRGDRVLLVLHGTLGRWLQPGGHVEPEDEGLLAAARREVIEETGIGADDLLETSASPFDVDVHEIPAKRDAPAHLHFDVRFLFRARTDRLPQLPASSGETGGSRWVALAEAAALARDASVARALEKLPSGG